MALGDDRLFGLFTGKVSMASTRVLTSSRASRVLAPSSSSMVTAQAPSAAVERTFLTVSRSATRSSMRAQTASSTSSGAAPEIGHRDGDHVDGKLRKDLSLDLGRVGGQPAGDDHQEHQQVGGDAVLGEPGDGSIRRGGGTGSFAHDRSPANAVRTFMPSVATSRAETQTVSPTSSPLTYRRLLAFETQHLDVAKPQAAVVIDDQHLVSRRPRAAAPSAATR